MSFFSLDTAGDQALLSDNNRKTQNVLYNTHTSGPVLVEAPKLSEVLQNIHNSDDDEDGDDFFGLPPPSVDVSEIINSTLAATNERVNKVVQDMQEASEQVDDAIRRADSHKKPRKVKRGHVVDIDYSDLKQTTNELKSNVAEELPVTKQVKAKLSLRAQRKKNVAIRSKTKGSNWFDMPATEITDDVRNELKIIQMRSVLDPKHFYKKNDLKVLPKYFQVGTVQHSPLDHYNERNTRKTKKSLVDQLLEDEAFQKFNKRKYKEVVQRTNKYAHRKTMKKMKKLKKNK